MQKLFCLVAGLFLASPSLLAGTLAQFRTVFGDIEVELYDQDKPATVQNFIRYVQTGRYQNEFAHRLVPGFVIQGGGFTVTNRNTTNWQVTAVETDPTITNEFGVGRQFSNVYGTIAMAKLGGDTNSASSQWFINLANNTSLDAHDTNNYFVVFGHVVNGTNVLNLFNNFQYWSGLVSPPQGTNLVLHQYYNPPFGDLPLLYPNVVDTNFVYLDITLLQVGVKPVPAGKEISWNSVSNRLNYVEYATNLPPVWNTLITTNGSGSQIKVLDVNTANQRRFYRVRVAY